VFETEPLPAEHPFWGMEQVLVLPHTASIAVPEVAARDVVENIRRLRAGQPLLNIVDRTRGY
jgi:glyoxylate/hydroxypyruvate reductase A